MTPNPSIELGRECFVRYHKGAATVAITFEPGTTPIVELFFPAGPVTASSPGPSAMAWRTRGGFRYCGPAPNATLRTLSHSLATWNNQWPSSRKSRASFSGLHIRNLTRPNHAVNTDAHRRRYAPWRSPVSLVR
jgi:hypothetical protein